MSSDTFSIEPPDFRDELAAQVDAWLESSGASHADVAAHGVGEIGGGLPDDVDPVAAHLYCAWKSLAEEPENGLRMLDLGHCYVDSVEDPVMAERVYEEIDRLGRPGLASGVLEEDPMFFLGWLYWLGGRDDESIEAYKQLTRRLDDRPRGQPEDRDGAALAHYHLGGVYHDLEMWQDAVREYDLALERIDDDGARDVVREQRDGAEARAEFTGEIGPTID